MENNGERKYDIENYEEWKYIYMEMINENIPKGIMKNENMLWEIKTCHEE